MGWKCRKFCGKFEYYVDEEVGYGIVYCVCYYNDGNCGMNWFEVFDYCCCGESVEGSVGGGSFGESIFVLCY